MGCFICVLLQEARAFLSLNRITSAPNIQHCYTPRKRAQAGMSGAVEAGNSRIPGFDNLLSVGSCWHLSRWAYWVWLRKQIPSTLRIERRRLSH